MADNSSIIQKSSFTSTTQTSKGTKIIKPGEELDKNAFLRILSAELANQDPTNAKDGTEFVSQMAQFTGLEQMANLNSNMRFTGASSLIGKVVMVNRVDENGNLYFGKVTGVSKDGNNIKLNVTVGVEKDENGELVPVIRQFNVEDVVELINAPEETAPPVDGGNGDEVDNGDSGENGSGEVENPTTEASQLV